MEKRKNGWIFGFTLFLALLYAFLVRSAFQFILSGTIIQKYAFYILLYTGLFSCLLMSFNRPNGKLYAPKGFYSIFALLLIIAFGLLLHNELSVLFAYLIALLIPFTLLPHIKESGKISNILGIVGIILALGCMFQYFFPVAYNFIIRPLFSAGNLANILLSEQLKQGRNTVAGFISNVGYTSFFIMTCIGAVFSFRKKVFTKAALPIILFMVFGLLLTGKRGPIIFLAVTVIIVYLVEGYGRDKIVRILKIAVILAIVYVLLMMLSRFTDSDGTKRIFEGINNALTTGEIDNSGRTQLYDQAWIYFFENPVLGIGWYYFKTKYAFRGTYVHNIYLQLLCETGVIGFTVFIIFFASGIIGTLKKLRITKDLEETFEYCWLKFSLFIQVYFLLYGLTGNPLYDIEETILYFFAVGISFLPLINREDREKE